MANLEQMVNNLVISDIHVPFQDDDAVAVMMEYAKDYKPDNVIINGDLVDFYSLSTWDKSPERKENVMTEVYETRKFLHNLRDSVGAKAKVTLLEGNHENRLQRFLWANQAVYGLDALKLDKLLELDKVGVNLVLSDRDYWGKATGHVKQGDAVIMHGDNRINGAKGGMNAGYNTMKSMGTSTIIGHTHRLSMREHTTPYHDWVGIEGGNLCQSTGTADWQQGFVTFETDDKTGLNHSYRTHRIKDGVLHVDGTTYYMK